MIASSRPSVRRRLPRRLRETTVADALRLAFASFCLLAVTAAQADESPAADAVGAESADTDPVVVPRPGGAGSATPRAVDAVPSLPEVRAVAPAGSLGVSRLDARALAGTPGGNGDFTSLLRLVPGVQFDNERASSQTLGEIQPANISINGAKFYDNLFLLDGASITNLIDPGASNPANMSAPSLGNSQGLALDTSLLCRVEVLDSNVGAEYGGFSGGVVKAETCEPGRAFGGEVSVEHTSSDWTAYKVHPSKATSFEQSAAADQQPSFDKWFYRARLEGRPSDELGLRLSLVKKRSEIPLAGYRNGLQSEADANRKVQTREDDVIDLRGWWTPAPGVKARWGFVHAPGTGRYFIADARDSFYELRSGGSTLSADLVHAIGDGLTLTHEFEAGRQRLSRDADASVWKLWRWSPEKNWGNPAGNSGEGGWGDVDQRQDGRAYRLKLDARPLAWGAVQHAFSGGLSAEHTRFGYERGAYEQYSLSQAAASCELATGGVDTELCSPSTPYDATSGGQYLAGRILHRAGRYELDDTRLALFVQDEIRVGRLRLRAGLRWEDDDLARKAVVAPRLAATWNVSGDGRSLVEAGANRYHASTFFRYWSNAERLAMQSALQRRTLVDGKIGAWSEPVYGGTAAMYHIGELDLPSTDELMLAWRQVTGPVVWTAKLVDRRSDDQVVLHLRSVGDYWWDNVGSSRARTWSLKAATTRPLAWAGTRTTLTLVADSTEVTSSHASYEDTINSNTGELDQIVRWDGRFIRWIDRPADNYNRPWTLKLATSTAIPAWRLTLDALLEVRDGYVKMRSTGEKVEYEGEPVPVYEKQRFGTATTVDLRAQWALPTVAGQEAYVALTVENLFDKTNTIEVSGTSATYEKGRQGWLRLGYRF